MFTFTLYPSPYGTGYSILKDGVAIIQQDFMPGVGGFQAMSDLEATAAATAFIVDNTPAPAATNP